MSIWISFTKSFLTAENSKAAAAITEALGDSSWLPTSQEELNCVVDIPVSERIQIALTSDTLEGV